MPVSFTYQGITMGTVDTFLDEENYTDLADWADNIVIVQTKEAQSVSGSLTIGTDLTVTGNLTVNGTTVTINSATLTVTDKNIIIANVTTPTDDTGDQGGITLKAAADKTLIWDKVLDSWVSNIGLQLGGRLYMNDNNMMNCGNILFDTNNTIETSIGSLKMTTNTSQIFKIGSAERLKIEADAITAATTLDMGTYKIVNLGAASADGDAVRKYDADIDYMGVNDAYTKSEADARYEPIDTAYTKSEADALYEPIDSCYTKSEAAAAFCNITGETAMLDLRSGPAEKIRLSYAGSESSTYCPFIGSTGANLQLNCNTETVLMLQNSTKFKITNTTLIMYLPLSMDNDKITSLANGTASGDAVNKGQLDAMLPLAGGTMSGAINMGVQKITNLKVSSTEDSDQDAVSKLYVDSSHNYTFSGASNLVSVNGNFNGEQIKRVCLYGTNTYSDLHTTTVASSVGHIVNCGGDMGSSTTSRYPFPYTNGTSYAYCYISSGGNLNTVISTSFSGSYNIYIDYTV